jgi:NitT/TauT family transport system ATP-binding protein
VTSEAITIRNLSKSYATRDGDIVALARISAHIAEGEFVAVVGPSGCGKSTLLKTLAKILPPSTGEALLRGRPIAGLRRQGRRCCPLQAPVPRPSPQGTPAALP